MAVLQQIAALRSTLPSIEPYAKDCIRLPEPMDCRAFFPGGDGLWLPGRPPEAIETLFLGSDFNNERNYQAEMRKPAAQRLDGSRTWAELQRLMNEAAIDPNRCFFTNAWPCLRAGDYPNCGNPPGAKDRAFTDRCLAFFRSTLQRLRPRFVIPLGTRPTQFLSRLDAVAMKHWRKAQWRYIDLTDHITLSLDGHTVTFIPAIHPSHPNQHHRLKHSTKSAEALHIRAVLSR